MEDWSTQVYSKGFRTLQQFLFEASMTDEGQGDREALLEQMYAEASERVKRQQEELQNERETALRTLRVTVILIGVLITFSDVFGQAIQAYAAQPFVATPSNLIAGIFLIPFSGIVLLLSPVFAAWSLRSGHPSEDLEPWDMRSLADGKLAAELNGEFTNPSHDSNDWYRYMVHSHSRTISDYNDALNELSFNLRLSHGCLVLAPILLGLGVWLSSTSF